MSDTPTDVGGLRSIEINFRPMRNISSGLTDCFLTRTHLNTPGLGVLMPDVFRPVAEAEGLSEELFHLELQQLAEAVKKFGEDGRSFKWISLKMPMTVICNKETADTANKMLEDFRITPDTIAFAVPPFVLTETDEAIEKGLLRLRNYGFHIIVSDFGKDGCPLIRLSELSADYTLLSQALTSQIGKNERTDKAIGSIISGIKGIGIEPIADGVSTGAQAELLYQVGCNYYAGPLTGDYITLEEMVEQKNLKKEK